MSEETCRLDHAVYTDSQLHSIACPSGVVVGVAACEVDKPLVRGADHCALFLGPVGQVGAVDEQVDLGNEGRRIIVSFEEFASISSEADDAEARTLAATRERCTRGRLVEGLASEEGEALDARIEGLLDNGLGIDAFSPARAEQVWVDAAFAADATSLYPDGGAVPWSLSRGAVDNSTNAERKVRTQADVRPPPALTSGCASS